MVNFMGLYTYKSCNDNMLQILTDFLQRLPELLTFWIPIRPEQNDCQFVRLSVPNRLQLSHRVQLYQSVSTLGKCRNYLSWIWLAWIFTDWVFLLKTANFSANLFTNSLSRPIHTCLFFFFALHLSLDLCLDFAIQIFYH